MVTEGPPKDSTNPLSRPHRVAYVGEGHDDALMAEGIVPRLLGVRLCTVPCLAFPLCSVRGGGAMVLAFGRDHGHLFPLAMLI